MSIIVPLYNKAAHVMQCLESLAAQTLQDIEIIVVDDGSTDDSGRVAQEFCENDSRFTYLKQANAGVSSALNRGIAQAQGKYIARVDADDWVDRTTFEVLYQTTIEHAAPHVRCGYWREYEDGKSRKLLVSHSVEERDGTWCFAELFGKVSIPFMTTCAALYDRQVLHDCAITYPEELTNLEDILFNARFYALDTPVVLIPESLYHYRETSDSLSQKPRIDLPEQLGIFEIFMQREVLDQHPDLVRYYEHYRAIAFLTSTADMSEFGVDGMVALRQSAMFDALMGASDQSRYPRSLRFLLRLLDSERFNAAASYSRRLRDMRALRRALR